MKDRCTRQYLLAYTFLQRTLLVSAIAISVFANPRYVSVLREASKTDQWPIVCVEPSPGLSVNMMQMISGASKNSGAS
jgi:hypothetical protein